MRTSSLARREFFIAAGLGIIAWHNRFLQDDAFISFRYAENLVDGRGLVFNPGERVQGFTNLLWTLLIAAGMALGIGPELGSMALSMGAFLGTTVAMFLLGEELVEGAGTITALLCGLNYSFSAYATGGLETSTQAFFFTLAALTVARAENHGWTSSRAAMVSAIFTAALWLRLDSLIPICTIGAFALRRSRFDRRILVPLGLPFFVGGLLLAAFQLAYYGDLLPNTFYAKTSGESFDVLVAGVGYLRGFVEHYWLYPFVALNLICARRALQNATVSMLGVTCVSWTAYVISVGGDFMEYRFFVPILPLGAAYTSWALVTTIRRVEVRYALVGAAAFASFAFARASAKIVDPSHTSGTLRFGAGVETISSLAGHLDDPAQDWGGVGRALGAAFGGNPNVVLAVGAAGAIPYYSKLTTIDTLGLCDRSVARFGMVMGVRPGHRRLASMAYLAERRATFVLLVRPTWDPENLRTTYHRADFGLPADLHVEAPLVVDFRIGERHVPILYLTRDPAVDATIRNAGFLTYPILF